MAVNKIPDGTQLKMSVETDKIVNGKPVSKIITYSNVDVKATNENIFATAYAIADLQKNNLLSVMMNEKSVLFEE